MAARVREYTLEFFTWLNAKGKKELIEWCMKEGLIASSYECPKCNDRHDVTWSAIKRFLRNRTSHAEADLTPTLQGTNRGSGPAMEESENDAGSLQQLLLYADEH
ncbi:brkDBD domain-containing protein [Trichonephila clavipes]|nr:brkDBD domain-containing protein [Trichonephila clavipes]